MHIYEFSIRCTKFQYTSNCCNPPKTYFKLKLCEISFIHNIHFSCQTTLRFCTEHDSDIAMLCTHFQNDLTIGK